VRYKNKQNMTLVATITTLLPALYAIAVGIIPFFFIVFNKSNAVLQFPPFSQALIADE
jgi:hypothetical protein